MVGSGGIGIVPMISRVVGVALVVAAVVVRIVRWRMVMGCNWDYTVH